MDDPQNNAQPAEQEEEAVYDDINQSDSQIDLENLTESQLLAIQEQVAGQQEIDEDGGMVAMEGAEEEEDDDVIDVDNPEDLAKKGLRRIQIEGDE